MYGIEVGRIWRLATQDGPLEASLLPRAGKQHCRSIHIHVWGRAIENANRIEKSSYGSMAVPIITSRLKTALTLMRYITTPTDSQNCTTSCWVKSKTVPTKWHDKKKKMFAVWTYRTQGFHSSFLIFSRTRREWQIKSSVSFLGNLDFVASRANAVVQKSYCDLQNAK